MPRCPEHCRPSLSQSNPAVIAAFVLLSIALSAAAIDANTVTTLSRSADSVGRTLVTVVCSEAIQDDSFRWFPLDGPPRIVVALEGINHAVDPDQLWIGDRHVEKVRLIHYPDRIPPELLVVLDVTSPDVRILELIHDQERLVIAVGTDAVQASAPISPTVPTPSPTPTPTATPPPIATPTRTATRTPVPPVSPEPAPSPVIDQEPSDAAASKTPADPVAALSAASPAGAAASRMSEPAVSDEARVEKITASNRPDGSTLLRISAAGPLPSGCARHIVVAGDPPRIVVTMRGVSAPDLPRNLDFDDLNLRRIRVIHDAETSEGELHMVLQPSHPGVTITEMKQLGPHLVVVLTSPSQTTDE